MGQKTGWFQTKLSKYVTTCIYRCQAMELQSNETNYTPLNAESIQAIMHPTKHSAVQWWPVRQGLELSTEPALVPVDEFAGSLTWLKSGCGGPRRQCFHRCSNWSRPCHRGWWPGRSRQAHWRLAPPWCVAWAGTQQIPVIAHTWTTTQQLSDLSEADILHIK